MAQILIRNIDKDIKDRLRKRAIKHGTSMEAEVRSILANVLKQQKTTTGSLGTAIATRFSTIGLDTPLPELHGQIISPVDFK
ncbi:MAG: toxin-antitoxin system [Thermodesulfobacteriota bacterium]|nr:toxin-antitoxin system [Thermodesulfobacteriota bacterium]